MRHSGGRRASWEGGDGMSIGKAESAFPAISIAKNG